MFNDWQDVNSSACYLFLAAGRWLSVGLNFALIIYLASVIFICIALREGELIVRIAQSNYMIFNNSAFKKNQL